MLRSVITTIQEPTAAVRALAAALGNEPEALIVVGDRKGPARFELEGCAFLDLEQQRALPFALARLLPEGHYARKNLGYLQAIRLGASCLYETDDDNAPLASWAPPPVEVQAVPLPERGWVNAYAWFTEHRIWPRGFPLDALRWSGGDGSGEPQASARGSTSPVQQLCLAPIQPGLANLSPDVDAVWRLVPVQEPEHLVVAGGLSAALPAEPLLLPHDRHLAQLHRPALPVGAGPRGGGVPCAGGGAGAQPTRSDGGFRGRDSRLPAQPGAGGGAGGS